MTHRGAIALLVVTLGLLSGCAASDTLRSIAGVPPPEPPGRPAGETRWVLIQNPRFGATTSEPEHVWVEEDRIPGTLTTAIFGRNAVLAPQHLVPRYAPPPENGQISPLQGGPPLASRAETIPVAGSRALLRPERGPAEGTPLPASPPQVAVRTPGTPEAPLRGYVIHVQAGLVVVDLTSADGVKKGSVLTLYRERVPLTHPVTGQYLGEMGGEEIGTAKVVEVRQRFSVAELQRTRPGLEPKVKDRVVVTQP